MRYVLVPVFEFVLAIAIIGLVWQLPNAKQIDEGFGVIDGTVKSTNEQIKLVQRQVGEVNKITSFDWDAWSNMVLSGMDMVDSVQIDTDSLRVTRDALNEIANQLDALGSPAGLNSIRELENGLNATADFIEKGICQRAKKAADQIDVSKEAIAGNVQQLNTLLQDTTIDMGEPIRGMVSALQSAEQVLISTESSLDPRALQEFIAGLASTEPLLESIAENIERVYPLTKKPVFPDGNKRAAELRTTVKGIQALQETLKKIDLKTVVKAVSDSKAMLTEASLALTGVLEHEKELSEFIGSSRSGVAAASSSLPKILDEVSNGLKQTEQLQPVIVALRQAAQAADTVGENWLVVDRAVDAVSATLKETGTRIGQIADNSQAYESSMKNVALNARRHVEWVPNFVKAEEAILVEFNSHLGDMSTELTKTSQVLPSYQTSVRNMCFVCRIAGWLVALFCVVHCVVILGGPPRRSTRSNA